MVANWVKRLKKDVKSVFKGAGHSKAGKRYLKKLKEIESTRLSRQSKAQLGQLSDSDYKEVMRIMKGR